MVVRPARAFGAPQTISSRPSLVSTWQTRGLSALGCCTASTILPTVRAASVLPGSSTCSTSRPAMVMASTTWSTVAEVSRCSLSQERVNFIGGLPPPNPCPPSYLARSKPPVAGEIGAVTFAPVFEALVALALGEGEGPADLVEAQLLQRHGLDDRAWLAGAVIDHHALADLGLLAVAHRPAGGRLRARQHEAQQSVGHVGAVAEGEALQRPPVVARAVHHERPVAVFGAWKAD